MIDNKYSATLISFIFKNYISLWSFYTLTYNYLIQFLLVIEDDSYSI